VSVLKEAVIANTEKVEQALLRLIPEGEGREKRLFDAMRYSCLNGGKRLRPFLVMQSAHLFGVNTECSLRVAAAIEMVHSYSLVHDDLPAMDDDDLRRGKPTCHKQFDDATAILAGDALQTLAFEILSEPATHEDPSVRCALVKSLAFNSGCEGMVGGQMVDIAAEGQTLELGEITHLQRLKTGALISFSCEAGAILGKADEPHRHALHSYAHDLGLAFQIADDLLDHEGTEEEMGKKVGKDADAGKATFVSILGAERAREQANILAEQAKRHLDIFEDKANLLQDLAQYVVDRRT